MGKAGVRFGPRRGPAIRRPEHPKRAEAKRLFEDEWLSLKRIARKLDVPYGTVYGWSMTWIRKAKKPTSAPACPTSPTLTTRPEPASLDTGWME